MSKEDKKAAKKQAKLNKKEDSYKEKIDQLALKRKWQMKYGFGIKIIPDQSLAFLQYRFTDVHGEEIDMKEEIEIK